MEARPLVSAIIIFLNAESFLREAIESVQAQSYEHWELWLIDDGSSDLSSELARRFATQQPTRIHYLDHEDHRNRGMSASRNLGLRHIRGEYVAFLDADDVWLSHKLKQQVEVFNEHPEAGMVYGPTQYWHSWTGNVLDLGKDYVRSLGLPADTLYRSPDLLIRLLNDSGVIPGNCSLLVRTTIVREVGGFEDSFTGMYEDQVFFAKVCLAAPTYVTGVCVSRYRQHPESSCAKAERAGTYHPVKPNQARRAFLDWLEVYTCTHGAIDAIALQRALRKQLHPYRRPALYAIQQWPGATRRRTKTAGKQIARRLLPTPVYAVLAAFKGGAEYAPPVAGIRFGSFRRLTPINRDFGFGRGMPIDQYYIERFLSHEAQLIRGHVLEVGDPVYTRKFGGSRVTRSDVLHLSADNPQATLIGDLADGPNLPSATFDSIILPQTLQFIYDIRAAVSTLHRILAPEGAVLVTLPGISHIGNSVWRGSWCWNFTVHSARRVFEELFTAEHVSVQAFGNVLAATAFLQGLAVEELEQSELDYIDPDYQVLIAVRARKGA